MSSELPRVTTWEEQSKLVTEWAQQRGQKVPASASRFFWLEEPMTRENFLHDEQLGVDAETLEQDLALLEVYDVPEWWLRLPNEED